MNKVIIIFVLSTLAFVSCQSSTPTQKVAAPPTQLAVTNKPTNAPLQPTATELPKASETPTEVPTPVAILQATPRYTEPLIVNSEKDIPYTKPLQPEVKEQMLDIYHPEQPGTYPVVLVIPRLSPNRGSMAYVSLSKTIAGQGAVVFIADFGNMDVYFPMKAADNNGRLFRQAQEEIVCALSFIEKNASQYGGDLNKVILMGHDTGGLYALDAALSVDKQETMWDKFSAGRGGPPPQARCLADRAPAKVNALVSYAGQFFYLDDVRKKDAALGDLVDPVALVGGNPGMKIALMTIMSDTDIPVEPTMKVKDALSAAGYQVELIPLYISSTNINAQGPELKWITNTVLQYAQP